MSTQPSPSSSMHERDLTALYRRIIEISQQLSTTYDYGILLRRITVAAAEIIRTEAASLLLLDEATGKLRFSASSNIKPHEMEEILVPLEGSIAGWIFTHGEPRVINDVAEVDNHFRGVDHHISFETRNLLGVPMRTHEKVIGVVQAVNKIKDEPFTDDDIIMLRTLASQAAIAIENARMFQQSDFMAEMVHELRTPLTALKMSTTLLNNPQLDESKRADIIGTMTDETERLIQLTHDFLDVARLESGRSQLDLAPFDTRKLIDESVDIVRQQAAEKNLTLTIEAEEHVIEADRNKTKQVLLNLLTNAVKYNRPNGSITVRTELDHEYDPPVLQFSVIDTGYGISREHQKHMFQKFYRVPTTENLVRGTGLGLTICKHIVEAHGGRIWLESEEDSGSTFAFTLPVRT